MPKVEAVTESAAQATALAPSIDPRTLVIDLERNGRRYPGKIEDMMASLLEHGQESPIRTSVNPEDGKRYVIFGFRRALAAVKITEDGLMPEGEDYFALRYEDMPWNPKLAFLANAVENLHRKELTSVDKAHNISRMKAPIAEGGFEMTGKEIARSMNVSEGWVTQTLKLTKLSPSEQKLVAQHEETGGKKGIAVATAYELADLEPEERAKALKAAQTGGGKVTRTAVRKQKSKQKPEAAQKARTAKEIRLPFEEAFAKIPEGGEAEPWQIWCQDFCRFCTGKVSARSILSKLADLCSKK